MSPKSPPAEHPAFAARTLSADVQRELRATGYPALRGVNVVAISAVVLLQGRVPSYHMKQVAQATVMNLPGVREIRNELDVVFPQSCESRDLRFGRRSASSVSTSSPARPA